MKLPDCVCPELPEQSRRLDLAARWTSIQLARAALRKGLETLRHLLQEKQPRFSDDKTFTRLSSALESLESTTTEIDLPDLGDLLVSSPLNEHPLLEAEHRIPRVAEELRSRVLKRLTILAGCSTDGQSLLRECIDRWAKAGLLVVSPRPGQAINLQSMLYHTRCALSPQQMRLDGHGPYFVREVEPGLEIVGFGVVAKAELVLTDDPTELVDFILPPRQAQR